MSLSLVATARCPCAELSRTVSFSDFSTREMQLKADIGRELPRVRLNYDGGAKMLWPGGQWSFHLLYVVSQIE